jgi:heme A synthase
MAKTTIARTTTNQTSLQFDRIAATCAALVVVGLAVFLLVRNEEIADPRLFFVLRVVLSFSTATLGATIPGFLEIGWSGHGLVIRAGGALALFVLTFLYTPDLVTKQGQSGQTTISAPGGVAAGSINKSPITINPQPPAPAPTK